MTLDSDHPRLRLDLADTLPADGFEGTLVARVWRPGQAAGPAVAAVRHDGLYDISAAGPTMSDLLEVADPAQLVRASADVPIDTLPTILENTVPDARSPAVPHLLPPIDLQVIKAGGVNFVASLLERVVEERAAGDPDRAKAIRDELAGEIGADLAGIRPGSAEAAHLKTLLIARGLWSQYLEVGIGPDAEIFTKAPVLSAVGTGADVGIHPRSHWNNPEPEIVLVINSRGRIVGATLGNDVNLRDFEGRSALLLGRAKDNNGSCALGPFIRLFDESFSLADVWQAEVSLLIEGADGFRLEGRSAMAEISRSPDDFVAQLMGGTHSYPDGVVFFTGTMFAPVEDRDEPGQGFTHKVGDIVTVSSPMLGTLVNRVGLCDQIPRWDYGVRELMRSLAARGLL